MNTKGRIPIAIGVTGHRDLRQEEIPELRSAVRREIRKLKAMCPASPFVMLTSLAEGADQLCAEIALEEDVAISAVLPVPLAECTSDYSEEGFKKLIFLTKNARDVFVSPAAEPARGQSEPETDDSRCKDRDYFYRQADIYIAEHCHVLLALWNGAPPVPGGCGTAETVEIKLLRTFAEKSEESLHPDNGCVIHIHTGRVSGTPCGDAGRSEFLGDENWLRKVLKETDTFNAEAACEASPETNPPCTDDPVMARVREIYNAADILGIKNAVQYKKILRGLSAAATFLTIAFLLYDEAEMYWMILICGFMLLALVGIRMTAKRLRCHRNYLEYRLLAESLRVEQYLRRAGLITEAAELFSWSLQINAPWIKEACEAAVIGPSPSGKEEILDCWVRDQKNYHLSAGGKTQKQIRRNNRIVKAALVLSVIAYIAALFFEIKHGGLLGGTTVLPEERIVLFRTILKVLLGELSALTLFAGNYYGKLSLEETAEDHARMYRLYETAENKILAEGEKPEILLKLAKEELGENSNWYAYQSMNKPEISL